MNKDSKTKVEPIRNLKDIRLIKMMLRDDPLDLTLFTIGINTTLSSSELLNLKIDQVSDLDVGQSLYIDASRSKKEIRLNKSCIDVIERLLDESSNTLYSYLFTGQRGQLTVNTLNSKVKSWCKEINLLGNYGSTSLRKTWGYHQIVTFKEPLDEVMKYLNHPTRNHTLEYLCLQEEPPRDLFKNEI